MMKRKTTAAILLATLALLGGCASRGDPSLAFTARTGGAEEIYLYDLETGELRQLTFNRGLKDSPVFSADGRWVMYASDLDGDWEIFRVPAEGGDVEQLTFNLTADLFPAPGIRDSSVVFLAVDDTGPVLRHLDDPGDPGSITTLQPDFETRPDGLVFDRTGGLLACVFDGDIWMANLRSHLFRPLVEGLGADNDPAWTADSRALVFAGDRGEGYDLYVVDLETGEPDRLTVEPGDERHPAVDSDNQTVYFFGDISGRPGVYRRVETPAGRPTLEFVFGFEDELTDLILWP